MSWQPGGIALQFIVALNIFVSITASVGNTLILIALHKVSSIFPPRKLLFRCLAVTDLCIGLITEPIYITMLLMPVVLKKFDFSNAIELIYDISFPLLSVVTISTSTFISVDRLVAILLGLRYRHVVTLRRVRAIILCFWLSGAFLWTLWRFISSEVAMNIFLVLIMLCLVISTFCYMKIFLAFRHQQAQVENHVQPGQLNGGGNSLNIALYKKTVSSIAWVQLALLICYAPYTIMQLTLWKREIDYSPAFTATEQFAEFLFHLNSSLNPILFCWRIGDVRKEVKKTIRKVCCCSS